MDQNWGRQASRFELPSISSSVVTRPVDHNAEREAAQVLAMST
jgi:hypothetical protein